MKYLENRFRDELGQGELVNLDNGVVKISGMAFESLDILEIASANKEKPTVYDQAFDAWRLDVASRMIALTQNGIHCSWPERSCGS